MAAGTPRKYGVVIFGATGFAGRLAAEYFTRHYLGKIPFAIAGRSRAKLDALLQDLAAIDAGAAAQVGVLVGDSSVRGEMDAIAEQTDVVCTTAGPYAKYGTQVIAACAAAGTAYCDLTGEAPWVAKMEAELHATAETSGARLAPCAGFDSVPSDLGTYLATKHFKQLHGEAPDRVDMYVRHMKGKPQGGTIATVLHSIEHPMRAPRGVVRAPAKGETKLEWVKGVWRDSRAGLWTYPFIMAGANQPVVRRSNAQLGYAPRMIYRECCGTASVLPAVGTTVGLVVFVILLVFPPTRWLLRRFVLPKAGEGPPRSTMVGGSYSMLFVASGKGRRATLRWKARGDPGQISTTILLCETAACLRGDAARAPLRGGLLTPVSATGGDALADRLRAARWLREDPPAFQLETAE